ncbi:hypothetical protein GO491_02030 [Flavobacteriaceae bacterium Ap0902]|nr:hypothetical protein [Flavobacteriaceae bacterium Ap0902]
MKNIFKYTLSAFILGGVLFSCNEDDMDDQNYKNLEENSVHFESTGNGLPEATSGIIPIVAFYSSTNHTTDVTANVNLEGNTSDFEFVNSDLTYNFPAGVYSDTIFIQLNDNFNTDGDRELVFTLASVSNDANLGYPGPESLYSTYTLTVVDDDCAYTLEELGNASWSGSDNAAGDEGPNTSQIVSSYDGTNLYLEGIAYGWLTNSNYWDEEIVESYPVLVNIAADGSLTIEEQLLAITLWDNEIQPDYYIRATGRYESCSERMIINYDLIQGGAILRSYTETITKNN